MLARTHAELIRVKFQKFATIWEEKVGGSKSKTVGLRVLPNKEGVFRLMTGTTTSLACRSAQQQPTSTRVGSLLVISKVLGSKRREIFFYSLLDDEERERRK